MIAFIFFVVGIATIIGSVVWGMRKKLDNDPTTNPTVGNGVVASIGALLGLALVIFSLGWREIGPGQVGVVTNFGQVQEGTLAPGLRWVVPFVQDITIFDGRIQAYAFADIEGATKDLQAVGLSGLINFRIDPDQADEILQKTGGPGEYAEKVFLTPARTALKEITPRYNANEVIAKRDEIGQETLLALQERMARENIIVDRVSVENISLNPEFLASVEQKQIAQQNLLKADFEQQRVVKLAEGERDARIIQAEGEAQANDLINQSLTDNLLQWSAIQHLSDKIRVMLVPSDQGLIFDLKGLQDEPVAP